MSQTVAILIASLGASLITGTVSVAIMTRQRADLRAEARHRERRQAYADLLAASTTVVLHAGILHSAMKVRSGLSEGLDVVLHIRQPLEPLDLWESMRRAIAPLMKAWSEVWVVGSLNRVA